MEQHIAYVQAVEAMRKKQNAYFDFVKSGVQDKDKKRVLLASSRMAEHEIDTQTQMILYPEKDMPPSAIEMDEIKKTAVIASNMCSIPCEVVVLKRPDNHRIAGYLIQPDLKLVEINIKVYTFLKEFSLWYQEAHQISSGIDKVTVFTTFVSALFDFAGHWNQFCGFNPQRAMEVMQVCLEANRQAAANTAKVYENKKSSGV